MRHRQMRVQCRTVGPVFVEHEDARIGGIDVEVIGDATGFGARGGNLGGQQRGLYVNAGTVTIEDLTLYSMAAIGGMEEIGGVIDSKSPRETRRTLPLLSRSTWSGVSAMTRPETDLPPLRVTLAMPPPLRKSFPAASLARFSAAR